MNSNSSSNIQFPVDHADLVAPLADRYDVVIVGARVAGAATAMLLARRGLSVLAIDRGRYGADVVSTHSISPAGVLQLSRWGVLDSIRHAGTPVTRQVVFDYGGTRVPIDIPARGGIDGLYNPRRTVLDPALVDAAIDAGADVRHGVSLRSLTRDRSGRIDGVIVHDGSGERSIGARFVVGADGVRSRVAAEVGAAELHRAPSTLGTIYAYFEGIVDDTIVNLYEPGRVVGTIPTNDSATLVWIGMRSGRFSEVARDDVAGTHARDVDDFPEVHDLMRYGNRLSGFRSFPGLPGFLREMWGDGWILVGDSGYFKDPISAHGITDALIGAELVANAISDVADGGDEVATFTQMQVHRDAMAAEMMPHVASAAALPDDMDELMGAFLGMSAAMRSEWALVESEFGMLVPV